jgi:hypothetical protein
MAGRLRDARSARVAEPPMALHAGFAEMLKVGVMPYPRAPSVAPVSTNARSAPCRTTLQWENKTCFQSSETDGPDS